MISQKDLDMLLALVERKDDTGGYAKQVMKELAHEHSIALQELRATKYTIVTTLNQANCRSSDNTECSNINWLDCLRVLIADKINWVQVSERLPDRFDEDYLVVVRNKNKPDGIAIVDLGHWSSDCKWIKFQTYEDVIMWAELPKRPF